jgi:parallel beta-helix repeat protein
MKQGLQNLRHMAKTAALIIIVSIVLGTLFLAFQVPIAESANFVGQTIYLRADGSIEPMDAPVDVHGMTYTLTGDIQCPRASYCIFIERSGILLDGAGYSIVGWEPQEEPSSSGTGIYAGFVSNVAIQNIAIKGCVYGIEYQSVSGGSIQNTNIVGQFQPEGAVEAYGIFLLSCDEISVHQNSLVDNYVGLLVEASNCTVTDNVIMDNTGAGVNISHSKTTLVSNTIARNDVGIQIVGSNNLIKNNDIASNKRIGVIIREYSPNNVFIGNNIVGQNGTGAYGIQMEPYAGNNTFYSNDFENNRVHVEGGDYAESANVWDRGYPSGGNYWDTYEGADNYKGFGQNETGSDGIGDAPYQITAANVDRYPLMQPVKPNPDISEEPITQNDYTLLIAITLVVVICAIPALALIYWRRRKKETRKEAVSA